MLFYYECCKSGRKKREREWEATLNQGRLSCSACLLNKNVANVSATNTVEEHKAYVLTQVYYACLLQRHAHLYKALKQQFFFCRTHAFTNNFAAKDPKTQLVNHKTHMEKQ